MWITRRADRRLSDRAFGRWCALLARGAHEREQMLSYSGNTIVVDSPSQVRRAVWDYFDAAHRYEEALHGLEFRLGDPAWHGDPAEEQRTHLDPARAAAETAAIRLIETLAEGGRPPRRWTLRRWTRRVRYLRWYLREQQWRPEHRRRDGDPWAAAPIAGTTSPRCRCDDEPPF